MKGIIASVAPRDEGKKTERRSRPEATLPVEGPHSLTSLLAQLSLGPPMISVGKPEKKVTEPLSGDWNVSGMYKNTPNDLDKGPIFGRFLDKAITGPCIPVGGCKRKWCQPEWIYQQKRTRCWPERGGWSRASRDWHEYTAQNTGWSMGDGECTTGREIRAGVGKRKWLAVWSQPDCLYAQKRTRRWPERGGGLRAMRDWWEYTTYDVELGK